MRGSDHRVPLLPSDRESIVVNFELMRAIIERESYARLDKSPVQIPGNRLAGPLGRVFELLPIGGVRIGFGQKVSISVLVERMFGGVNVGRLAGQRRVLLDLVLLFFEFAIGVLRGFSLDASAGFRRRFGLFRLFLRLFRLSGTGRVIPGRV